MKIQNFKDIFQNLKNDFLQLLPDLLVSVGVLIIGYFIARLVKYLVIKLFVYLGRLAKKRFAHINFKQAGVFLATAFFWLILFTSLLLITDILGLSVLTEWFQSIVHYLPNVFAAIFIVFAAIILGNLVSDALLSIGKRTDIRYSATLVRIIRFTLLLMAIVIALDQIGIEIALLINIIDIVLASLSFWSLAGFWFGRKNINQ